MPTANDAAARIRTALESTVITWPGYDPATIPFAVYDDEAIIYINHPSPPPDRPANLLAATAVEIGGVQTATIPAGMVEADSDLIPLAYHEGFHVHQAHHFTNTVDYDFFLALANYPELDPTFRALCRAEADLHNQGALLNEGDR